MEIEITKFFQNAAPQDYSASICELGQDAGNITWRAAMDDAADYELLDTEDKREAFREHIKGFGAWDDAEIAAWTNQELNALCIQMIAGDMREIEGMTLSQYEDASADGQVCGRICLPRQSTDGKAYYYLGS